MEMPRWKAVSGPESSGPSGTVVRFYPGPRPTLILTFHPLSLSLVPPSGLGSKRQFSIAGRIATWQRNQLTAQSICDILFYKNHMDRMGVQLDISRDAVSIDYETIIEADVENLEEATEAVRTIEDWRGMWNAGMKRR